MSPTLEAFLRSWAFDPWLTAGLLITALIYVRGWRFLHRRDPERWHSGSLSAFLGGLAAIYLALASPIEPFAGLLLQVHMVQHLLLMMVAPPLLWLGSPLFPMLRGLPRGIRIFWAAPLLASPGMRRFFGILTHPLAALPIYIGVTGLWHIPSIYDLAMRSNGWHYLQHLSFLFSALLFWYPVVRPYPSRPRWSLWLLLPYLFIADVFNTALSAVLTFSDRVIYSYYDEVPRLSRITAPEDQATAGLLMWVPGSIVFLVPLFVIGTRLLYGTSVEKVRKIVPTGLKSRLSLPLINDQANSSLPFDLLRLPLVGRFLKWRYARVCLQLPILLLATAMIYDGFTGPQSSPTNLAGVLPWIHWRGLLILGLLVAGNIFCMGCPFVLPRTLARQWIPTGWNWPRPLRSKWLAVILIVVFLWAYEAFSLWDRPWWTACLALGYFVAAFVVDSLFRGGTFCKYVCPIGQFNFVQSLASPLEMKVRDPAICQTCQTKDCIRGRDGIPGCELNLYLPRKASNMDCTLCLDCVHGCPHDNIMLMAGMPGKELSSDRQRSGVGRWSRRPDIAALILVLVFGAFANAAGMIGPVVEVQAWLAEQLGITSPLLATTIFYLLGLIVLPIALVGSAAWTSRRWGQLSNNTWQQATRYAFTFVPLGFGMWLAHSSFHFLMSYESILPVTQRFAIDLGITWMGAPNWNCACCGPMAAWQLPLELFFLDVGLLLSLYAGYRLSISQTTNTASALKTLTPWALLMLLLFITGVWILFQPMQMRGML
ncbi:MAG TPA: cytochrome c oxidase assembly protein [Gemmatales bacterium]|nr:cytochrome c oxidase assembly protein [Gemmatales bacterium]